jgi:non-heme chloroperoxidase
MDAIDRDLFGMKGTPLNANEFVDTIYARQYDQSTEDTVMTGRIKRSTSRIKAATLRNGITLQYVEQGDPAGVPVVLLHGYSDSWYSFEPLLPYLPSSFHAFALTQRGHGDADRPKQGYMPGDFAADVAQFAEALGLGPIVVGGHSMGTVVAQQFAIDYPSQTLGLIGIGTLTDSAGNPALAELWSVVEPMVDPIDRDFVWEFQESTLAQPIPTEFLERCVAESLKMPAWVWKAALAGLLATDLSQEIDKIAAPALMIWGDRDEMTNLGEQHRLIEASLSGRLAIYEGAGHAVHWEEPARVAADITTFVEQLAG